MQNISKFKILAIAFVIVVLAGIAIVAVSKAYLEKLADYNRMTENTRILNTEIKTLKSKNGEVMTENGVLQMTVSELKQTIPTLEAEIKNMKIKMRNVKGVSQQAITTSDTIYTTLYDTIIRDQNTPGDTLLAFDYHDEYTCINGIINTRDKVMQQLYYETTDSIIQIVHRDKFRLFRKRKLLQTILLKNPHATITYQREIVIVK